MLYKHYLLAALIAGGLITLFIPGELIAANPPGEPTDESIADVFDQSVQAVPYRIAISGIEDPVLLEHLQSAIDYSVQRQNQPRNLAAVEKRTRSVMQTLESVLRSLGYYGGALTYDLDTRKSPVDVQIDIATGPIFKIKEFTIAYSGPGKTSDMLPDSMQQTGVDTGGAAESEFVIQAEARLLNYLAQNGHPLAVMENRDVVVNHQDESMSVTFNVAPGPLSKFGVLKLGPLESVDEDYVSGFITWLPGEIFNQDKVDLLRSDLLNTGLFESVLTEWPRVLNTRGELPVTAILTERKHRSIGFEAHWSTDEGIGTEVFWENRNLFGKQERLTFTALIEEVRQELDMSFRKPRFYLDNQSFLSTAVLAYEDTDAYTGPVAGVFAGLERTLADVWTLTPGLWAEESELDDFQGERRFSLYGASFLINRDTSDDRLDPGHGSRLSLSLSPYRAEQDEVLNLLESRLSAAGYYSFDTQSRYILATRARLGSVSGAPSADLPANKRFYAGGGSSIRGYAYQSVGPSTPDGTPLGGRSLFEIGTELRFKINQTLGAVAFFEGGNVYEDTTPKISGDLRWSAGFGARYFTAVGPIRIDLAFPLDKRPQDDSYQFYLSVGQAF